MIIPDEFFKLVFFVAENTRINCRKKHGPLANKTKPRSPSSSCSLTKSILDDGGHEEGGGDQGGGHEDEEQCPARHHHVGSLSLVGVRSGKTISDLSSQ